VGRYRRLRRSCRRSCRRPGGCRRAWRQVARPAADFDAAQSRGTNRVDDRPAAPRFQCHVASLPSAQATPTCSIANRTEPVGRKFALASSRRSACPEYEAVTSTRCPLGISSVGRSATQAIRRRLAAFHVDQRHGVRRLIDRHQPGFIGRGTRSTGERLGSSARRPPAKK